MTILSTPTTLFTKDKAIELAKKLNADAEDSFNYIVEDDPKGTGYSRIAAYFYNDLKAGYL